MTRLVPLAALAVALACGVGYAGYAGYDSLFALVWGEELARGEAPSLDGPFAPAPHPLLNAVALALAPLGDAAARGALEVLALASLALLAVAAFRLGRALFSRVIGAVFAALLLTRPEIVELSLNAQLDVAFLALVLLAAALAAEHPRRATAPLALLAAAGLLRPEAWVLAAAYALYLRTPRAFALAAVAPVLWAGHDLLLTGDPLFSLHGTQDFAERGGSGSGLLDALELAPDFVADVTGGVVALGGAAGWLLYHRRAALPAALFALSVGAFLVYGLAGLTLYARFLLPAAAMLALLCAAAMTHRIAGAVVALAVAATVPFTIADLADVRSGSATRARLEAGLVDLLEAERRCPRIHVPTFRLVARLAHDLDVPPGRFTLHSAADAVTVEPVGRSYVVDPLRPDPAPAAPALGREIAHSDDWRLRGDC